MHANTDFAPAVSSRPLKDRLGSYLSALRAYHRERRGVVRLSQMSDQMLRDIGLTRNEVRRLQPRPFRHFVS